DGRWIASSGSDNRILLWDATSGEVLESLSDPYDSSNYFRGLAWSANSQYLAAGSGFHGIQIFDMLTDSMHTLQEGVDIEFEVLEWSPDGKMLASMANDGAGYVWNM